MSPPAKMMAALAIIIVVLGTVALFMFLIAIRRDAPGNQPDVVSQLTTDSDAGAGKTGVASRKEVGLAPVIILGLVFWAVWELFGKLNQDDDRRRR